MLTAVRTKRVTPKPAAPQADPRFQNVRAKIGQKAAQIKKHPPAKLKADEAAKAANAPPREKIAGAKEKQTDLMQAAKPKQVEPDNFRTLLRAEIKKVMPETLDDADNFMEDGKEEEMKGAVSGKVSEQKSSAESQIKTTTTQKPSTAGVKEKEVKDLPPVPPTPIPVVNTAEAMPVPRTEAEISQQQSKRDADQQLKDAQVTPKQLKKADDPRFTAVLTAKSEAEQTADASPAKYRAKEKTMLGQTVAKSQSDGRRNFFALANVKIKSGAAVKSRQSAAQAKDEKARKEVADNIEAMYEDTKATVEEQLSTLETTVFSMFDNGSSAAIAEMKSNTEREIDEFNDDRYSGIGGKLDWIADQFRATPKGIVKIINRNLELFKAKMDALIDRVADTVETRLKQAKAEIDKGQAKIKTYVSTLKDVRLKAIGKAAEKEVAGRFDEMREGVEERKNALAQKLAESYKSAIDKGNALASELEAENAGAAYKLAKKIAEIAKLILDFKDKLVAILKKAVSVILDILSDPIGFFGNLIDAIGEGFSLFRKNFANNFKTAIAGWLFGSLGSVGFELPKDLSPGSIVKLVMGIAGLTYERLRAKAVKLLGNRNVALLEKLYEFVKLLITGSPDELWAKVKEDLGNLQDTVIGEIKSWLITSLVEAGIKKLLSMVVPGAGFVQAALAIYKLIVFLIERAAQIAAFISSVVDSVADIVKGNISAAAKRIEQALIQALSLIIDLLARLLSLGGIAEKIKSIIKKVQDRVDKAIDKVLAKIVQSVKKLFGRSNKKSDEQAGDDKDGVFKEKFSMGREGHTITATLKGKALTITMASDADLILSSQLTKATTEVQQDEKREDSQKKAILSHLSAARILVDGIRTDYVQAGKTESFDKFMKPRLAKIIGNLSELTKYKPAIESLQHIISIGKPRSIPSGIEIRRLLYDKTTGGKWKTLSKKLRIAFTKKISPELYAIWKQRDDKRDAKNYKEAESKWNALQATTKIPVKDAPTFASYNHPKHFDQFEYETDHIIPLGEFWKGGEKNSDDKTRKETTLNEKNLQVLTKEENNKKSGVEFERDVGPNFSSVVANSPKNSKTIDGKPFEEK